MVYEWKKLDVKTKQPYATTVAGGQPIAFVGLWDAWKVGYDSVKLF
jgi:putative SOS response-associated peptidase YedK